MQLWGCLKLIGNIEEKVSSMSSSSRSTSPRFDSQSPVVITDLESLRRLNKPKLFRSSQPIVIKLPEVSANEAEALVARVNGYRNECGCSLGAKTTAAGFGVMVTWLWLSNGLFTMRFLSRLPFAFVFAMLCAGLGKSIGIALARRRLRLELDQLHLNFSPLP